MQYQYKSHSQGHNNVKLLLSVTFCLLNKFASSLILIDRVTWQFFIAIQSQGQLGDTVPLYLPHSRWTTEPISILLLPNASQIRKRLTGTVVGCQIPDFFSRQTGAKYCQGTLMCETLFFQKRLMFFSLTHRDGRGRQSFFFFCIILP